VVLSTEQTKSGVAILATQGGDRADDEHRVYGRVETKRLAGQNTCVLKELHCPANKVLAGEELHREDHHSDLRPAAIRPSEATSSGSGRIAWRRHSKGLSYVGVDLV
jgi:hypothetical protein